MFLSKEIQHYVLIFSIPHIYNIPNARSPPLALDPATFFNDDRACTALHASSSKNLDIANWVLLRLFFECKYAEFVCHYNFHDSYLPGWNREQTSLVMQIRGVELVAFFDELAANASACGVSAIIYSGNDDFVLPHFSSRIPIQVYLAGFQPSMLRLSNELPVIEYDLLVVFRGSHASRRHLLQMILAILRGSCIENSIGTYALIADSGHEVPEFTLEAAAFLLFREFILGNNSTGLVTNSSDGESGGGDEYSSHSMGDILPGDSAILFGSGTTTSVFVAPPATIASWEAFLTSVQSVDAAAASATFGPGASGAVDPSTSSAGARG
ncbi:hypothetical protein ACEPAI_3541 [Sanghuangporus weigelae]